MVIVCLINFKWNIFFIYEIDFSGARSLNCDLESQIIIVTNNTKLQHNLHSEKSDIFQSTSLYIPEGDVLKTPLWVRFVLRMFKNYF